MTEASLVDVLGMIAGAIWISGAVYFQLIREGDVHPGHVIGLLVIGIALMMASSAVAFAGQTILVELLAVLANGLFILLGIGAWYTLECHVCIEETKAVAEEGSDHPH